MSHVKCLQLLAFDSAVHTLRETEAPLKPYGGNKWSFGLHLMRKYEERGTLRSARPPFLASSNENPIPATSAFSS